ncbi:MAG: hypothetical protein IKC27_09170 [Kiritimatiellae bacterium]|nr:hypothetical protein [Kiritimatiellia bacterium]
MSDKDLALPGLEALLEPVNARPGDVDMTDGKKYTAELIFKNHPNVFKSAARLLFVNGLSERSVAAALMLSVNTVRAIRNMAIESNGRGDSAAAAFFIKSKAASARKLLQLRALEALQDRLENEKELKEIGINSLLCVIQTVDTLDGEKKDSKISAAGNEPEVIDVEIFDSVLNGLSEGEKPRARGSVADGREDRGPGAGSDAPGCSTENGCCVNFS